MADLPQVAVAGVGGYAGAELARLLLAHPRLQGRPPDFFGRAAADGHEAVTLTDLHPHLARHDGTSAMVEPFRWETLAERGVKLIFLATPHEESRAWVPRLLAQGVRVVDLSGAWRLHVPRHRAVYNLTDADTAAADAAQAEAVYGLPELHRAAIRTARLVANPGCYATSLILALAPLVRAGVVDSERGIVCDAKSGVSGAGKTPTPKTHFMHAADNLSAYAVFGHRHLGELLEQLHLREEQITFTPHLLPIPRGIFSTVYVPLKTRTAAHTIDGLFRTFYADASLVRWRGIRLPEIQHVVRSSYCDLGFALAPDGQRLIVVACLDNLMKGASAQAVENMNLMFGWPEQEGLV